MIRYRFPSANLFDIHCQLSVLIQDGKVRRYHNDLGRIFNFDTIDLKKFTEKSVDEFRARDLFDKKSIVADGNILAAEVPHGIYNDPADAMNDIRNFVSEPNLESLVISADMRNSGKKVLYTCRFIPGSESVQIIPVENDKSKDIVVFRFSTEIKLKNASVPLKKMKAFEVPYFYVLDNGAYNRMVATKAVLTYGDKLEFCVYQRGLLFDRPDYEHYVVRKRVSDDDWIRSFFYELDKDLHGVVNKYVELIQQFIGLDVPKRNGGPIKESFFFSDTGVYMATDETQKVARTLMLIDEGIKVANSFRFAPAKMSMSTLSPCAKLSFIIESKDEKDKVLEWLQKYKVCIPAWSDFVRDSLNPLHQELERIWKPIPYVPSEYLRAIAYYIYKQIRMDPILYADHANMQIRHMAHALV